MECWGPRKERNEGRKGGRKERRRKGKEGGRKGGGKELRQEKNVSYRIQQPSPA